MSPLLLSLCCRNPPRSPRAGHHAQIRQGRQFIAAFLHGCPTTDDAVLLASELAANAIAHTERAGYYSGARTDIINSHAELRAALDMLIKAAEHTGAPAEQDLSPEQ